MLLQLLFFCATVVGVALAVITAAAVVDAPHVVVNVVVEVERETARQRERAKVLIIFQAAGKN